MNTLHFTCPHCMNLMAVNVIQLGKNVRCPHCRQVVPAPAPAPRRDQQPAPEPHPPVPLPANRPDPTKPNPDPFEDERTFQMPEAPRESHDSIFGESIDEDVFGSRPIKPIVPPADEPPTAPTRPVSPDRAERLEADFGVANTVFAFPNPPASVPAPHVEALPEPSTAIFPSPDQSASPTESPAAAATRKIRKPTVRSQGGSNLFTWLLAGWAVVATIAAVYFSTSKSYLHPFQAIPDVYGEYDKADRKKTASALLPSEKEEVPLDFRISLGASLIVNQLEIQPQKVEAGSFRYFVQRGQSPPTAKSEQSCFLLRLKLKNVSSDLVFHPIDPAFNRMKLNDDLGRLYNRLTLGSQIYPGGLFPWRPGESALVRDYLEGQEKDPIPLKPGESREYVIPSQHVARVDGTLKALGRVNGLWRVQLRTGVVSVPPREVAVTSVVGIQFTTGDIQ